MRAVIAILGAPGFAVGFFLAGGCFVFQSFKFVPRSTRYYSNCSCLTFERSRARDDAIEKSYPRIPIARRLLQSTDGLVIW
ncbi:hypothetical protein IW262DRAFT_552265 [Armillaria fumosa]|nr:hypothetical protein IW262DRAFT_552265 [Armillaria fumosa]